MFTPLEALGILFAGIATFMVASAVAVKSGAPMAVALVAGELALVAVPVVVMVQRNKAITALGLRRPDTTYLVAAALIGSTLWFLNVHLVNAIDSLFTLPETQVHTLQTAVSEPSLPIALFAIALVPAVCEEILFRGVLLRGLASRFVPAAAIAASAILFSAYHLSIVQLVPTLTLGLALGFLAFRARSAVPAIVAHLINNTLAVLIGRGESPGLWNLLDEQTVPALALAVLVTGAGIVLAARGPA